MKRNNPTFLQDLYIRYFARIDQINFTRREIDIIACLVNARRTSKISSLLSIAPSTVITHIRNIMLKVECNSQEGIIDFIEKSQKLGFLKKYYASLVNYTTFEKSLKACFSLKKETFLHLVVYCKDQTQRDTLTYFLKAHLKLAGIEAKIHIKPINPPITDVEHQAQIYLFLKVKDKDVKISKPFSRFKSIDVSHQPNYYCSVFEILGPYLPKQNLNKIISEFRKTYEAMESLTLTNDISLDQNVLFSTEKISFAEKKNEKIKSSLLLPLKRQLLYLVSILVVIGLMGSGYLIFFGNESNKKAQTFNPTHELEWVHSHRAITNESILLERPELLHTIDAKFKQQNALQIIALVGPGGAGKTTLARQYAYQQTAPVIWEINAETAESIKASYENLAEALAKKESDNNALRELKETNNPEERENKLIQFIKEKLKTSSGWILIYDNLGKLTDIKKYLPQDLKSWGSGKVILTTRDDNIQNDHVLPVGPLNSTEKYNLFCKIIKRGETVVLTRAQHEEINEFLKEIPPFPLDVSVAAHYIRNTNTSYKQYLKSALQNSKNFVTLQESLLKEAGDYTHTRYRIITLPLQQMINISKDFRDLLLLVTLIDSQNIPRDVLDKYKNNEIVDHFIYHLKKYSLLINHPFASYPEHSTLSFHRSTHTIFLSYLKESLNLDDRISLISSISNVLERYARNALDHENLLQMDRIKSHLKAFLSHKDLLNNNNKGALEVELGCAYYYTHYQETAKRFLSSGISRLELYPSKENHSRIAQALSYLGNMHKEIGKHQKARDLLEKSILLYKQHNPQNYVGMMRALAYLGDTYKNLGNHQKARDLLEKSIVLSQKHSDTNQLETARTLLYLGIVYRDLGEYEKSISLLKRSITLFKKHENYIELARALKYLGNTYRSLGQYEEARVLLEQSVLICRKYLSENHIALGRSLVHLATIYKNLGEYQKSKELLVESLQIHQQVFGGNSVRTAWVVIQLANIHREMGEYEKAKELINDSLKTYLKSYGENSLRTSWAFIHLSYVYEDLKNYKKAQETLETALKVHRNHFEENHIKIANILFHLGNTYRELGHFEKAINLLEKSLNVYERHYGKEHIETARVLQGLGKVQMYEGKLEMAETTMNKALEIFQRKKHPEIFLIFENLAELHLQKAQIEKNKGDVVKAAALNAQATSELKQALALTQALFPEHSAHMKRISAMLSLVMNNQTE